MTAFMDAIFNGTTNGTGEAVINASVGIMTDLIGNWFYVTLLFALIVALYIKTNNWFIPAVVGILVGTILFPEFMTAQVPKVLFAFVVITFTAIFMNIIKKRKQ